MKLLVNIDVDDLNKAEAFYREAFDLTVGRRFGDTGVELLGGEVPLYLLAKAAGSRACDKSLQQRDYSPHWTPVHLDFVVEDLEVALGRAILAGAREEKPVAIHGWGKLALMRDPFGHGFCFIQFIGRGYDELTESFSGLRNLEDATS